MELGKLKALAEDVKGWSNCDTAWLDPAEDELAAVVGHISEDGEKYCVTTVDCDQYYAAEDSLKLAKFYAAANPATVLGLIDTIENLAALVNRLCRQINKGSAANDVAVKAAEYMHRNNLLSTSLLRDDEGVGKLLDMVNPRIVGADSTATVRHNVEFGGTPAASSPEAPLERRVGGAVPPAPTFGGSET